MLEKPDLPDETLLSRLRDAYGVPIVDLAFLPLGNDVDTAVYRAVAADATPFFLKLRRAPFDGATVAIPHLLHRRGIAPIIPPIATRDGRLWARVGDFAMILSPFIAGRNGFVSPLSDRQWVELGVALKGIHAATVPESLGAALPREGYAPHWRDRVRQFQARVEDTVFIEPIAAEMAAFLRAKRDEISHMIERAEALGAALRGRSREYVLCHADIHAGNVLIGADGALYIVDWDTLIFAPKERDLMFIGGGIGGAWNSAREGALFYRGYGQTDVDPVALAYYRYERIVEDIAEYCERLLLTDEGGADRAVGLGKFPNQFLPNNVVAIAYQTDQLLGASQGSPREHPVSRQCQDT